MSGEVDDDDHVVPMKLYLMGNTLASAPSSTYIEMDRHPHKRLEVHNDTEKAPRATRFASGHWKLYLIISLGGDDDKGEDLAKKCIYAWNRVPGVVRRIRFGIEYAQTNNYLWFISEMLLGQDFIDTCTRLEDVTFLESLRERRKQSQSQGGGGSIGDENDDEDNDHLNWRLPEIILPQQTVIDAFYGMKQKEEEKMQREEKRHKPRKRIFQRGMNKQLQQQQEHMQKQMKPAEHAKLLEGLLITQEEIDERNARNSVVE